MKSAKSVSKNSNVGTGRSSYKGVKDEDMKPIYKHNEKEHLCFTKNTIQIMFDDNMRYELRIKVSDFIGMEFDSIQAIEFMFKLVHA